VTAPSVGRVVHYASHGSKDGTYQSECRAAIVSEVADDNVGLVVLNPSGLFFRSLADGGNAYDDSAKPKGGTWHWPERV